MSEIIAIANQKGGVGKTTTAVNLGIGLVRSGKRVLLIDADPQGSMTAALGYEPDSLNKTVSDLMLAVANDETPEVTETIIKHSEGVDLIPSNIELSALELSITNFMSREVILRELVEPLRDRYDYILIDCMPSLGMMTINALAAADSVLIPVQAAHLPVIGLQQLIKTIMTVKKRLNRKLQIKGIVLTMVDMRSNLTKDVFERVHENYGDELTFKTYIPMSVKAAETSAEGISIYEHCRSCKVSEAYEALTKEVISHE